MKKIKWIFVYFVVFVKMSYGNDVGAVGEWKCEIREGQSMDAFAYAQNYRYPSRLIFSKNKDGGLIVKFEDQRGQTNIIDGVLVVDDGVVFKSSLGVKDGVGKYPIHRIFLNGDRLAGMLITDSVLFLYDGIRQK